MQNRENIKECPECQKHTFLESSNPKIESMCLKCGFTWAKLIGKYRKYTKEDKILFNMKGK